MKLIAVICNNRNEWNYFVETLQWKLSKENKPYKASNNYIQDTDANVRYYCIHCGNDYTFQANLCGREWDDYITMCFMSDEQVEYVKSKIKGENYV